MKFKSLFFAFLALAGLAFVSCNDTDDDQKFSTATVEENKVAIQDQGLAMLSEFKAMQSCPSVVHTSNAMSIIMNYYLLENNPNFGVEKQTKLVNDLLKPIAIVANIKNSEAADLAKINPLISILGLIEDWSKLTGTYTWNFENYEWDYTAGGNEVCIKFPSVGIRYAKETKSEDYPVNDAVIRIYGLKTVTGTYSWIDATTLPIALNCELKVYSNSYLNFAFSAAYNTSDSRPSSIKANLDMQNYRLAVEASNNDTAGSVSINIKKSNETLMALNLNANGDWSEEALEEDYSIGSFLSGGNASIQLMNIKVAGNVDLASINKAMESYTDIVTDSSTIAEQCDIINKYAKLSACFVNNNQIIAKVIAYPSSYTNQVWNEETQQYDIKVEFEIGFAFKFADDSVIDAETYFSEGFDVFIYQLRNVLRY